MRNVSPNNNSCGEKKGCFHFLLKITWISHRGKNKNKKRMPYKQSSYQGHDNPEFHTDQTKWVKRDSKKLE